MRALKVSLMVLLVIVGALAGVVVTGLLIGVETVGGARTVQIGTPLLLISALLLVVGSILFARKSRTA